MTVFFFNFLLLILTLLNLLYYSFFTKESTAIQNNPVKLDDRLQVLIECVETEELVRFTAISKRPLSIPEKQLITTSGVRIHTLTTHILTATGTRHQIEQLAGYPFFLRLEGPMPVALN